MSPQSPVLLGVTGHRDLRPEDVGALTGRIDEILSLVTNGAPSRACLYSPLAEGADRLAAQVVLSAGGALKVPLPMAQEDYEQDFQSAESLSEFRDLLARAEMVETLPPLPADAPRSVLYARVGAMIAVQCQIMLALWDGQDTGKMGGTSEVVRYCLEGVPQSLAPYFQFPSPRCAVVHLRVPRISNPHIAEPLSLAWLRRQG